MLAVKSHQSEAALADLVQHAPETVPVVCAQNGVTNEPATLRRFIHTYAITVMLPAQHLEPGVVVQACHPVPGILDIGRYPSGTDEVTERVSADLRSDGPNSLGQSLARGLDTEVDFRAGEIVLLGRLHGVPTPASERVQRAAHELLHPK